MSLNKRLVENRKLDFVLPGIDKLDSNTVVDEMEFLPLCRALLRNGLLIP